MRSAWSATEEFHCQTALFPTFIWKRRQKNSLSQVTNWSFMDIVKPARRRKASEQKPADDLQQVKMLSKKLKKFKELLKKHLHLWKQYTIIYFVVERAYFNIHQIGNAPLAQLVEHLTLNQGVQGSSPWRRT